VSVPALPEQWCEHKKMNPIGDYDDEPSRASAVSTASTASTASAASAATNATSASRRGRECPVCLETLEGTLEITTACCKQRLHTKCLNDMIDFYESTERDTPCPLCRSLLSRYIAVDIPDAPSSQDRLRSQDRLSSQDRPSGPSINTNGNAQKLVYCVSFTVFFNMLIMFTYKLAH
jgi:hypothetical protein